MVHPEQDRRLVALVVDDEPLIRQLIRSILRRHGWRTIDAASGEEALAISAAQPDLLITDHNLPAMSGLELAQAIRRQAPDVPVLVMSGGDGVGRLAANLGYQFIRKPFDFEDFLAAVVTTWNANRMGREVRSSGQGTN